MTHSVRSRILIRIVLYVIVLTKRFFSRFWRSCMAPIRTIIIYIYIYMICTFIFFSFFIINIRKWLKKYLPVLRHSTPCSDI